MSREKVILKHINKAGTGIEVGPSHSPLAPQKKGYKVHIIDHLSQKELRVKYKNQEIENIEPVDFIWKGETYLELTGNKHYYDWIIASHVIEHTPDFIGFLKNCSEVLKENGVLSLALPDYRNCFDHFREKSSLGLIIDAHLEKRTVHSPGTVLDYHFNVVENNGRLAWGKGMKDNNYNYCHSLQEALVRYDSSFNKDSYIDVHSWCFTPKHFAKIINALNMLKFIDFGILELSDTTGHEFFVTLKKGIEFTNRTSLLT